MGRKESTIEHPGVVAEIRGNTISVRILSVSACASCHAKGACRMAEMEEKHIEVEHPDPQSLHIGQTVTLSMVERSGHRAVILAYALPFAAMLATLILVGTVSDHQALAGLAALGILVPYYLILYLFRRRLSRYSTFRII
ncbi:MAG TPA: SoxR reducing system RseC family protein [Bacteroidales bacterium]|nr:SoxR reducing system RseC family protein [Bacteroidales bacterium]HRZ77289.1 SoxR reducing system RseC family protein [Bacteroidales bacterium]